MDVSSVVAYGGRDAGHGAAESPLQYSRMQEIELAGGLRALALHPGSADADAARHCALVAVRKQDVPAITLLLQLCLARVKAVVAQPACIARALHCSPLLPAAAVLLAHSYRTPELSASFEELATECLSLTPLLRMRWVRELGLCIASTSPDSHGPNGDPAASAAARATAAVTGGGGAGSGVVSASSLLNVGRTTAHRALASTLALLVEQLELCCGSSPTSAADSFSHTLAFSLHSCVAAQTPTAAYCVHNPAELMRAAAGVHAKLVAGVGLAAAAASPAGAHYTACIRRIARALADPATAAAAVQTYSGGVSRLHVRQDAAAALRLSILVDLMIATAETLLLDSTTPLQLHSAGVEQDMDDVGASTSSGGTSSTQSQALQLLDTAVLLQETWAAAADTDAAVTPLPAAFPHPAAVSMEAQQQRLRLRLWGLAQPAGPTTGITTVAVQEEEGEARLVAPEFCLQLPGESVATASASSASSSQHQCWFMHSTLGERCLTPFTALALLQSTGLRLTSRVAAACLRSLQFATQQAPHRWSPQALSISMSMITSSMLDALSALLQGDIAPVRLLAEAFTGPLREELLSTVKTTTASSASARHHPEEQQVIVAALQCMQAAAEAVSKHHSTRIHLPGALPAVAAAAQPLDTRSFAASCTISRSLLLQSGILSPQLVNEALSGLQPWSAAAVAVAEHVIRSLQQPDGAPASLVLQHITALQALLHTAHTLHEHPAHTMAGTTSCSTSSAPAVHLCLYSESIVASAVSAWRAAKPPALPSTLTQPARSARRERGPPSPAVSSSFSLAALGSSALTSSRAAASSSVPVAAAATVQHAHLSVHSLVCAIVRRILVDHCVGKLSVVEAVLGLLCGGGSSSMSGTGPVALAEVCMLLTGSVPPCLQAAVHHGTAILPLWSRTQAAMQIANSQCERAARDAAASAVRAAARRAETAVLAVLQPATHAPAAPGAPPLGITIVFMDAVRHIFGHVLQGSGRNRLKRRRIGGSPQAHSADGSGSGDDSGSGSSSGNEKHSEDEASGTAREEEHSVVELRVEQQGDVLVRCVRLLGPLSLALVVQQRGATGVEVDAAAAAVTALLLAADGNTLLDAIEDHLTSTSTAAQRTKQQLALAVLLATTQLGDALSHCTDASDGTHTASWTHTVELTQGVVAIRAILARLQTLVDSHELSRLRPMDDYSGGLTADGWDSTGSSDSEKESTGGAASSYVAAMSPLAAIPLSHLKSPLSGAAASPALSASGAAAAASPASRVPASAVRSRNRIVDQWLREAEDDHDTAPWRAAAAGKAGERSAGAARGGRGGRGGRGRGRGRAGPVDSYADLEDFIVE